MDTSTAGVANALVKIHMNKPGGIRSQVSKDHFHKGMLKIDRYVRNHVRFKKILEMSSYKTNDLYRMAVHAR